MTHEKLNLTNKNVENYKLSDWVEMVANLQNYQQFSSSLVSYNISHRKTKFDRTNYLLPYKKCL